MISKFCSQCRNEKPIAEFYSDSRLKDGHKSECKDCHNKTAHRNRTKGVEETEYIKGRLRRTGFKLKYIKDNPELVELKKQLLILKRTIWQSLRT